MGTKRRQSLAGAVRQRLAAIEQQLAYGIRQDVIRQMLEDDGIASTEQSFRNALFRARKVRSTLPPTEPATSGHLETLVEPKATIKQGVPAHQTADSPPKPVNPLLQHKGFVYRGTIGLRKEDLI